MPDIPSGLPDSPHTKPGASAVSAIGGPVRAAVPDLASHDAAAEVLAKAIADLFVHPDVVWHTSHEVAANQEKANFLRITSIGDILLDIIKPGVRFSTGVHLDAGVDLRAIKACIAEQSDWEKDMQLEGFLPEGMHEVPTEGGTELTNTGGDGATYVFNRTMVLRHPRGKEKGLRLRWIGKHTNPAKGEKNYKVNDTLTIEEF